MKLRTLSIVAASMLGATLVMTGCGGGGSSTPTAVKKVIVSDGYVLEATVKCKTGGIEPTATATNRAGEYELPIAECAAPAYLCARDGYIDVNDNGQVDVGEPKAPKMTAPGDYTNINPYTTLIQGGMTPEEVAQAFGLPANTNFDVAIPEVQDKDFVKNAIVLSALLAQIVPDDTTRALDGLTLQTLVQELKSGKTIDEILPPELKNLQQELDNVDVDAMDSVAATYIKEYTGAYEGEQEASSSTEGTPTPPPLPGQNGSSSTSTTPGDCLPGAECTTSSEATSSSSSAESSSSSSSASTTPGDCLPGAAC